MQKNLEQFLAAYEQEFINAGEQLNREVLPDLTEELFAGFERTGNRLEYETVYFKRRKFLSVYAILVLLYGRECDVARLEEVLASVCGETCWALPAHVSRDDEHWPITIDLFAAETAFSLAEIVGKLGDKLAPTLCDRVRSEVFRRVLNPFMDSEKPYADWEVAQMNWCAVCCGSIGAAAIWLMQEDKQRLDGLLRRISASILNYVDGFSADGACLEGLSYYTYGMSFFVAFADMAYKYSEGQINLLSGEKVKNIALFQQKCFLPGNLSLSFSDSSLKEKYRVGLTAYLVQRFPEGQFPPLALGAGLEADNCYRYVVLSRDLFWAKEYLKYLQAEKETSGADRVTKTEKNSGDVGIAENSSCMVLPDAQWAVRSSRNGCVVAGKGGHNAEPHNHNDVGSFLFGCDVEMILTDLGAGEYTKDYFNEKRYEYLCCRSLGHNLPIVNGREQRAGREYAASAFEVNLKEGDNAEKALFDERGEWCEAYGARSIEVEFAKAYGLFRGEQVRRRIALDYDSGNCRVWDEFCLKEEATVTENLITTYKPRRTESGFIIQARKHSVRVNCEAAENYRILEKEYADHYGKLQKAWLMQWDVVGNEAQINVAVMKKGKADLQRYCEG